MKGIVILLLSGILLAVTKPSKEKHAAALSRAVADDYGRKGPGRLLGKVAAAGTAALARNLMDYHDYAFFSTMTLDGDTVSVGALGLVVRTGNR